MVVTDRIAELRRPQHYAMAIDLTPAQFSQITGGKPTENAVVLGHGLIEWGTDQDGKKFLTVSSEQGSERFGSETVVSHDGVETHLIERIDVKGDSEAGEDGVTVWKEEKGLKTATITDTELSFSQESADHPLGIAIAWSEVNQKITQEDSFS